MKLKSLLALTFAASSLVACGGTSPEDACRDQAAIECNKMYTCDAQVKVGDDEKSCVEQYQSLCVLAAALGGGCEDGKSFSGSKADECTKAMEAQTCEAYNKDEEPAACAQVCE